MFRLLWRRDEFQFPTDDLISLQLLLQGSDVHLTNTEFLVDGVLSVDAYTTSLIL